MSNIISNSCITGLLHRIHTQYSTSLSAACLSLTSWMTSSWRSRTVWPLTFADLTRSCFPAPFGLFFPSVRRPAASRSCRYVSRLNLNYIHALYMLHFIPKMTNMKKKKFLFFFLVTAVASTSFFLALLCATAQQSYCRHAGVRRPSSVVVRPSSVVRRHRFLGYHWMNECQILGTSTYPPYLQTIFFFSKF